MSIYTGIEHEFIRLCVGSVYVCVLTVKAPVVVLCLQFCVTTNVRDCPQFFSHFVKSISAQLLLLLFTSLVSSQWDHYATSSHLYQDGTQCPAVFDCFQAGPNSVVWLESVFLMDFFY